MGTPIYILAGQSNAKGLRAPFEAKLTAKYGAGGYQLVTVAVGGAQLLSRDGGPDWATPSELPRQLIKDTAAALKKVPGGDLRGLIWVQGEADTFDWVDASSYKIMLSMLFDRFGHEVKPAQDMPIAVVKLSGELAGRADRAQWDNVRAAQAELAAEDPAVSLVSPDAIARNVGLTSAHMFTDELHYSPVMKALLASAGLDSLIEAHRATPPVAPGPGTKRDDLLGPDGVAARMAGGTGNDVYHVDRRNDHAAEQAGEGQDTVIASVSFSLRKGGQNVETLMLGGSRNLNGFGNAQDNALIGNGGNNRLKGGRGDDTIRGRGGDDLLAGQRGDDSMSGGMGDDVYVVGQIGDRIFEGGGEGHDTVRSRVSFTLRDHGQDLEDLRLRGKRDLDGIGNSQDNLIAGNKGDNRLNGAWGNDRLKGGRGDDRLADSQGDDIYTGGGGVDLFVFERDAGRDRVTDFKAGTDKLVFVGLSGVGDVAVSGRSGTALLRFGEDAVVKLDDVRPATLNDGDFLFI
ncbi:sialate O-acetylesterase [Chachezhania antarctica]|mgnify:CR=1 FL=1|uniref:sialate O-acetylesterase n=1 Tax=Chachezhania antarctica TaxID=2340860 RepID=UPI0013CE4A46|nr:sialate O-acetylesterase [Chachezhania antarctica]